MAELIPILFRSLKDILMPKILRLLILPFVGSFMLWTLITWMIWDWIIRLGFQLYNFDPMQRLVEILSPYFVLSSDPIVAVTAGVFILVIIVPAAIITAMLIASSLIVPALVSELRKIEFTQINGKPNTLIYGLYISIIYSAEYILMWIGLVPFWIALPLGTIIIPYVLLSWFNSRLFAWEVMLEIATPEVSEKFIKQNSKNLFLLGLLTSIFYYIPFVNLFAPVISSAGFARYCLTRYVRSVSSL
jgi:hypothetical protein